MTALPDGWTIRRPTLDDVPAILEMTMASDIAAVGEPDFTADDVREALTDVGTDMARDCRLALDAAGTVMGWAFPHNPTGGDRDFVEVYTWPERGLPAQRPLLSLIMARVAERGAERGFNPYCVRAAAIPTERPYIEALTDAGFVFLKRHARMRIELDSVSPVPPSPDGVTVRTVRADDEDELRRFHGVIETAFRDTDHLSVGYDTWRAQIDAEPSKTWDEWFVAEAGGEIAGVLQSSDGGEPDEGWVKRLAVLRAYRKRGLGEALLRHAFAAYVAHGRTRAGLGVDMENPTKAVQLYLGVGMTPLYQADIFQTSIDTAA